jgi:hypothetical protein
MLPIKFEFVEHPDKSVRFLEYTAILRIHYENKHDQLVEAKSRNLTCGANKQNKSNKTASNQKKKNWLLLGILGAAAIASGDSNTAGFLLGMGCGVTGDNEPCDNAIRKSTSKTDNGFKWGSNYQKSGNNFYGSKNNFERVGTTGLYERDDGVGFQKIGNTLYGDDGTECRNVGSLTYCD